jgi:hypothetical protein
VLRRVAEPAIAVQIETKKIHHLCVSHQQFTEAKRQNVGTLLTPNKTSEFKIFTRSYMPPSLPTSCES